MDQAGAPAADAAPAAAAPAAEPAAGAANALGRIIMIQPDGTEGMSIPIGEDGATVGRTDEPPLNEDFFLSPEHARFKFTSPGELEVEDLGGLNGVFLRLIPEQVYDVQPNNIIRMGQEVVLFELLPEPKKTDDGTALMGSPRKTAWGKLSLIVSNGKMGNAFLLEGDEVMIGRERGHIIFPEDGYVSGLHLKITKNGDKYTVVDVGSSNGSYLRVDGKGKVNSGDYVLMGQYLYKIDF